MNAILVEGIPQDKQSNINDRMAVFLQQLLPTFNNYVDNKIMLKKSVVKCSVTSGALLVAQIGLLVYQIVQEFELFNDLGILGAVIFVPGFILIIFSIRTILFGMRLKKAAYIHNIDRIGTAYINLSRHRLENGSVLVDEDRIFSDVSLSYPSLKDFKKVNEIKNQYNSISSALPAVLQNTKQEELSPPADFGIKKSKIFAEEIDLKDNFNRLKAAYNELSYFNVQLGLLEAEGEITRHMNSNPYEGQAKFLRPSQDTSRVINEVMGIIDKKTVDSESVDIDDFSVGYLQDLSKDLCNLDLLRRHTLVNLVGNLSPRLSDVMHYSAYYFYCPHCHKDELEQIAKQDFNALKERNIGPVSWNENARVYLISWIDERWKCPLCERETNRPIPIHKLYSHVYLPAYNYLLLENENERVKIYTSLNEKKIEIQQSAEREKEEIERDSRREIDGEIFKLRGLKAQLESTSETIKAMKILIEQITEGSIQRLNAIDDYSKEIQQQIYTKNNAIVQELSEDLVQIRKNTSDIMEDLAYQARIEQQERDQVVQNMAHSLQSINQNTADTAEASRQIASNSSQIAKNTKTTAAVDLAQARRQGMDKHPSFRVGANMQRNFRIFSNKLAGRSELESAARGIK